MHTIDSGREHLVWCMCAQGVNVVCAEEGISAREDDIRVRGDQA